MQQFIKKEDYEALKAKFDELRHKKWDWQSFYNGWIEGFYYFNNKEGKQ